MLTRNMRTKDRPLKASKALYSKRSPRPHSHSSPNTSTHPHKSPLSNIILTIASTPIANPFTPLDSTPSPSSPSARSRPGLNLREHSTRKPSCFVTFKVIDGHRYPAIWTLDNVRSDFCKVIFLHFSMKPVKRIWRSARLLALRVNVEAL